MAKRSPILGYNHNVRYRGLVFHVQTEDSGVLAPHLFTHLFHSGVIISTRKYVYDGGSTEEAIKSLMQAQHKAVMKELRRGLFDDKIDQYLGGTPGLLPRGGGGGEGGESDDATIPDRSRAAGTPAPTPAPAASQAAAAPTPTPAPAASRAVGTPPALMPAMARTRTGDGDELAPEDATVIELGIAREMTLEEPALGLRPTEPALDPLSMLPPSLEDRITAQMAAQPEMDELAEAPPTYPGPGRRGETVPPLPPPPEPGGSSPNLQTLRDELPGDLPIELPGESSQEILIQLEVDDSDEIPLPKPGEVVVGRRRRPHDTETGGPWMEGAAPLSDGIPGMAPGPATIRNPGDASGAVFSPASGAVTGPISQRTAKAVGAASLPPARPIARPASRPAVVPPPGPRPAQPEDRRTPSPDSNEVYASAEPAGQGTERPGQYSQHKKISSRIPTDVAPEGTRPVAPQGVTSPPARPATVPQVPAPARPTAPTPPSAVPRVTPPTGAPGRPAASTPPSAVPVTATGQSLSGAIPMPASMTPSGAITVPAGHPLSGPIPVPASIPPSGAIQRPAPQATIPQPSRTGTPSPAPIPPGARPATATPAAATPTVPRRSTPTPMAIPVVRPQGEPRSRTPTPQRVSMSPSSSAGLSPARPSTNSGVVMTRPAVIVGAPAKPATPTSRVRKAREDEGRGFGQGLISEKSLDEVILAYLSEDAEDK